MATIPRWVTPAFADEVIQDAWVGQYLSDSLISRLIRHGTQGVHSHSQMFCRSSRNGVDVLEMLQFRGGQRRTLKYHCSQPGRIDVFSPDYYRWPEFDPLGAVAVMRRLTDEEYGWRGIWQMVARRLPGVWWLYPVTTDDSLTPNGQKPFCSHAVSLALHAGGGVDPVPRCPHQLVTPTHLTYSLFLRYEFSIATEWCAKRYGQDIIVEAHKNESRR